MTTPTTAADLRAMAAERRCDACGNTFCGGVTEALTWAADEIERLRKPWDQVIGECTCEYMYCRHNLARQIVEAALEPKVQP